MIRRSVFRHGHNSLQLKAKAAAAAAAAGDAAPRLLRRRWERSISYQVTRASGSRTREAYRHRRHPCRFSTSSQAMPSTIVPQEGVDVVVVKKEEDGLAKKDSLHRLMELSRQEWSLIALSASTLGVTSSVTLLMPYASGMVIDYTMNGAGADGGLSPMVMAGGLFGLNAFAAAGVYLRTLWLARAGNRIVARLKQRLYASLLKQDSAWLDQQTTGDLLSRLRVERWMS